MDDKLRSVWVLIDKQQQGTEGTAVFSVGEQLRDILYGAPELAEIVEKDLEGTGMGLAECEREVKKLADARHKKSGGNCVYLSPLDVYPVIRKFYGLPEEPSPNADAMAGMQRMLEGAGAAVAAGGAAAGAAGVKSTEAGGGGNLSLEDFF